MIDYWFRYDIFFNKLDVECRISGEKLKVYVHANRRGLDIKGQISRLKYPGERWGQWTQEEEEPAEAGHSLPDPYPTPSTCSVFLNQTKEHRASSGTLYEYGINR